jgi:hypothetical protein
MNTHADDTLAPDCELASHLWRLMFGGLTAIVYRQRGTEAFQSLRVAVLGHHQTGHYRDGLRKLGIRDDEPPAIAAAKYHFLSNAIGGLTMQYIEESATKVWLRYLGPMWTFPGMTMLALPSTMRRSDFTAWHPKNGVFMGCPRLGWVSTKSISEGDPYDEGYFREYGHDLSDAERMRYETVLATPECDPAVQPALDPQEWPAARRLKAQRRFAGAYVASTVEVIARAYGEREAAWVVSQAMAVLASQYTAELVRDLRVGGTGPQAASAFFRRLLRAFGQRHSVVLDTPARVELRLEGLAPFSGPVPERIRDAFFDFQRTAARIQDGRLAVGREPDPHGDAETWTFHDAGRWLW